MLLGAITKMRDCESTPSVLRRGNNANNSERNLYFFYCTVPCVASVYSIIEFILDWCGKLKPLQPLITAPIFVVGYVLSFVFQSTRAFCYNDDMDANIQCVYHLAGLDYWYEAKNSTGTLASSIGGVGIGGAVM